MVQWTRRFRRRPTRKIRRRKRFKKMRARNILPSLPQRCYVDVYIVHNYYLKKHIFSTTDSFVNTTRAFRQDHLSSATTSNGIPWYSLKMADCYAPYPRVCDSVIGTAPNLEAVCIRGDRGTGLGTGDYWKGRNDIANTIVIGCLDNSPYIVNQAAPTGSNSALFTETQPKGWDAIMRWYQSYRPIRCKIRGYVCTPTRSEALEALVTDGLSADYTDPDGIALWMDQSPMYFMSHLGPYSCDAGVWNYDQEKHGNNVINMFGQREPTAPAPVSELEPTVLEEKLEQCNATWVELAKRKSVKVAWLNQSDSRERKHRIKVDYKIPRLVRHEDDSDETVTEMGWNSTQRQWSQEQTAAAIKSYDNHTAQEGWGFWTFTFGYKTDVHTHYDPQVHQNQGDPLGILDPDPPAPTTGDQIFRQNFAMLYCNFTQKWRVKLSQPINTHDNKQYKPQPANVH